MPPGQPPSTPPPPPPVSPPPAPPLLGGVDLRVSRRLLWIGSAAYPLHNIARVHTLTLHPKRKEAVLRFLKNGAIIMATAIALTILSSVTALASTSTAGGLILFVWLGAGAMLVYSLVEMASVLNAPAHYVLAVETSGPSTAVVTSRDPAHLNHLVGQIAHAIDHPEAEFQVKVESITVSPNHYYFGDNVNMYGGSGNVGITT
ncbi:hypothetical protein CP978_33200 [Streptomyces nodosus]|uniref:Uncharacterized protein n=1 Tax=Streptomyces nodosus TaxID=40318 RepID=A0A0B5DSK0_9ACTN|nr:hypothetical protein SNOD_32960 [Streptomyces nodosus]QEV43655.1 hypothetical protein CP978_33200 [Streptomyces nodosus]